MTVRDRSGDMGRIFKIAYRGRALNIVVASVDEAWELWLCEQGRRLVLASVVTIDSTVEARRNGEKDPIAAAVQSIKTRIERGELVVPRFGDAPKAQPAPERPRIRH